MKNHSSLGGLESNIVPILDLSKLLDPVFLCAHRLVDHVPRDRLIGLLPVLRRAVRDGLSGPALPQQVGEKNLSPASRREPPTPSTLAVRGPARGMRTS